MVEKKVCITNEIGLHARAASKFLNYAVKYKSDIEFIKDNKKYNAKSIISILSLCAHKGCELILRCEGEDEQLALDNLSELIESGLDY
ncbi:MAG: HPr family phosphocarrier protein [Finegoldia sp.]|uniref:HPr family phosphocarrier protein n=1 Tax=Finegoldia sp. TaxID=1981334 RepID=UPI0025EC9EA3|nr:HPr family phosphocarrier protein [uncultured Finegoldia sp.]MDU1832447.1 HPr family phosphocarrier protein [Finegoldia magna]MDU1879183.1 HPr family phosphocarrier protein [Finegoldia magna]